MTSQIITTLNKKHLQGPYNALKTIHKLLNTMIDDLHNDIILHHIQEWFHYLGSLTKVGYLCYDKWTHIIKVQFAFSLGTNFGYFNY